MTSRWGEGLWGTFLWGDLASPGRSLEWLIDVDWDGDGLFDGTNEAAVGKLLSLDITRGRQFFLKTDGTGFEPVAVGTGQLVFFNNSGRYNPYNLSSPIYAYLQRNQKIRIRCQDTATGIAYNVFAGYIDDIRPNFGKHFDTATMMLSDGLSKLKAVNVNSSKIYQTIRYNIAITQALYDAGWPVGAVNIDTTVSDTMAYWWESGRQALTEIQDLTDAAFGLFSMDAAGNAHYISSVSGDLSVMTLGEGDIQYDYGIQVPSPRETLKNLVRVYSRSRQQQALSTLWQAVDKPSIPAGGSITVWASFSYNNTAVPALSVTTPAPTTDYTANTAPDGSGTDKTAQITVVMTPFGSTAKLVYTNNDAGAVTMTLMKLRGVPVTVDPYTFAQDQDNTSIATYTEHDLTIQTDWLQDLNTAKDKATTLKLKLANPRQFPRVMVKRNSLAKSFGADLFSLVDVNFPSKSISNELRVGYIQHRWSVNEPNVVDTLLYMEPNLGANASGTWIFPALIGVTTKFA